MNFPAKWQAQGWVAHGAPPGTKADVASTFLESKGFRVNINSGIPHELVASKHLGVCIFVYYPMWDDLYVTCVLDDSDRVAKSTVELGVSPGL